MRVKEKTPQYTNAMLKRILKPGEIMVSKALRDSDSRYYTQYGYLTNREWCEEERIRTGLKRTRIVKEGKFIALLRIES